MNEDRWDNEQWELYGMFAFLLYCDGNSDIALEIYAEAQAEGLEHLTDAGEAEMDIWLRLYVKRGIKRPFYRNAFAHYTGNPLTLH